MASQLLEHQSILQFVSRHAALVQTAATASRDAETAAKVPAPPALSDRRSEDAVRWASTLLAQLDWRLGR
jgi:hypothetical protein